MKRGRRRPKAEPELVRFGVSIPRALIEQFDGRLTARGHANRSEAIRDLIREDLAEQAWTGGDGQQAAALTFVLDIQKPEAQRRVLECQREMAGLVVSALHARLSPREELCVLALRGPGAELRRCADQLLAIKGVLLGKLVLAGKVSG